MLWEELMSEKDKGTSGELGFPIDAWIQLELVTVQTLFNQIHCH
jgi:hypothetical protein